MATFDRFVGIDWGSEIHQVSVLGADRSVLLERSFAHTGQALHDMVDVLLEGVEPSQVAVAIETPRGPVVETRACSGFALRALRGRRERPWVAGGP